MINVKKGPAHSLGQADVRGGYVTGVTAGMVCYVSGTTTPGVVTVGAPKHNVDTGILGFAINNSTDGDAVESGKIALYTLDGTSIIETDQADTTINATNFPIGTPVYAWATDAGTAANVGKVTATNSGHVAGPIGWVEGIRQLQAGFNQYNTSGGPTTTPTTQNYISMTEAAGGVASTQAYAFKGQYNIPVLSIKLAAFTGAGAS